MESHNILTGWPARYVVSDRNVWCLRYELLLFAVVCAVSLSTNVGPQLAGSRRCVSEGWRLCTAGTTADKHNTTSQSQIVVGLGVPRRALAVTQPTQATTNHSLALPNQALPRPPAENTRWRI